MAKNKIFWTGNFWNYPYFPVLQKAFGHSFVPSSLVQTGKVKGMSSWWGLNRSPRHRVQSCISRRLRRSGEPRLEMCSGCSWRSGTCGTEDVLLSQGLLCLPECCCSCCPCRAVTISGSPVQSLAWVPVGGLCSCLQMEGGCQEGAVNPNLRSRSSWIRQRSAVRVREWTWILRLKPGSERGADCPNPGLFWLLAGEWLWGLSWKFKRAEDCARVKNNVKPLSPLKLIFYRSKSHPEGGGRRGGWMSALFLLLVAVSW